MIKNSLIFSIFFLFILGLFGFSKQLLASSTKASPRASHRTGWIEGFNFEEFQNINSQKQIQRKKVKTKVTAIDHSKSDFFPRVADQGSEGSCTAFSTVYYSFSYEFCRANPNLCSNYCKEHPDFCISRMCDEYPNESNYCSNSKVMMFSPRLAYNFANSGRDNGSNETEIISDLNLFGALTWEELPYTTGSDNFMPGYLANRLMNSESSVRNFVKAASRRVPKMDSSTIGLKLELRNSTDIDFAKEHLAEGHLWIWGTSIYGTNMYSCISYQKQLTNAEVDCDIGAWDLNLGIYETQSEDDTYIYFNKKGTSGAHSLAVVGYDDNKVFIINNLETRGGFKLVNSWGNRTAKKGFVWLPYEVIMQNNVGYFASMNTPIYKDPTLLTQMLYVKSSEPFSQLYLQGRITGTETPLIDFKKIPGFSLDVFDPKLLNFNGENPKSIYFAFDAFDALNQLANPNENSYSLKFGNSKAVTHLPTEQDYSLMAFGQLNLSPILFESPDKLKLNVNTNSVYSNPQSLFFSLIKESPNNVTRQIEIINSTNYTLTHLDVAKLPAFITLNGLSSCLSLAPKSKCTISVSAQANNELNYGVNDLTISIAGITIPIRIYLYSMNIGFYWGFPILNAYSNSTYELKSNSSQDPSLFRMYFSRENDLWFSFSDPEAQYDLEMGWFENNVKTPFLRETISFFKSPDYKVNGEEAFTGKTVYYTITKQNSADSITRYFKIQKLDTFSLKTTDGNVLTEPNIFGPSRLSLKVNKEVGICLIEEEKDSNQYYIYNIDEQNKYQSLAAKPVSALSKKESCTMQNAFFKFTPKSDWNGKVYNLIGQNTISPLDRFALNIQIILFSFSLTL